MSNSVNFRMHKKTHKKLKMKQERIETIIARVTGKRKRVPKSRVIDMALDQPILIDNYAIKRLSTRRRKVDEF